MTVGAAILFAGPTLAQEGNQEGPPDESEWVEQGIVEFDFSEPGVLRIDGSENRRFMPLPEDSLVFASEEEYFDFIHDFLNFEVDGDGRASLQIVTAGNLVTFSSDLQSIVEVSDPVATLIGGRWGIVNIANTEVCVNADRCFNPVSIFTLKPADPGEWDCVSKNKAWSQDFEIQSRLCFKREFMGYHQYLGAKWQGTSRAETIQVKGGFQAYSPNAVNAQAVYDCSFELNGLPLCMIVGHEPVKLPGHGENFLRVNLEAETKSLDTYGNCITVDLEPSVPVEAYNTDRVDIEFVSTGFETDHPVTRMHSPTGLFGVHYGKELTPDRPAAALEDVTYLPTAVQWECY